MSERVLSEAIDLFKGGDREQASSLLTQLVIQDQGNELAWMWLAACKKTDEEKRACLERVIDINPDNAKARQALDNLSKDEATITQISGNQNTVVAPDLEDYPVDQAPTIAVRRKDKQPEMAEVIHEVEKAPELQSVSEPILEQIVDEQVYPQAEDVDIPVASAPDSQGFFPKVLRNFRQNLVSYILLLVLVIAQVWSITRMNVLESALVETRTQLNETMMELLVLKGSMEN